MASKDVVTYKIFIGGLKSSAVGHREQGTGAVDFYSEVITIYIDHASILRQQARFI